MIFFNYSSFFPNVSDIKLWVKTTHEGTYTCYFYFYMFLCVRFPSEIWTRLFYFRMQWLIYTTNFRKHSKLWKIFMGSSPCLRNHLNLSWWQITITKSQLCFGNLEMLFFMHLLSIVFIIFLEKWERILHKMRCKGKNVVVG